MAFKLIEVTTPEERVRAVTAVAEELNVADVQIGPPFEDGRRVVRLLAGEIDRQALLDRLQAAFGGVEHWHIAMVPTDTVIPREPERDPAEVEAEAEAQRERASREELYHLVAAGVHMDATFLLLVALSTVVASVGLEQDSAAVVIGAMVIAPLLGPNLAFAFATAIGDRKLTISAAVSALSGIALSIIIAAVLALLVPPNVTSVELLTRTAPDYASVILALASGAAAALSVTTGLSSAMVGVMVAVALLPPAATVGIMLAAGQHGLAAGAATLLGANVVCVNLAAQVVFVAKGLRPRRWRDRQTARMAVLVNLTAWLILLAGLVGLIAVRQVQAP